MKQNITVRSGRDYTFETYIIDARNGNRLNLTGVIDLEWAAGASLCATCRSCSCNGNCRPRRRDAHGAVCAPHSAPASIIRKTLSNAGGIVVTDAVQGEVEVTIDASDTEALCGEYYHEMVVVASNGKQSTVLDGQMSVTMNLIKRP